jgi:uncharacterized membrane protein
MMTTYKTLLLSAVAALSLSACTTDQFGERRISAPLKGAGIGAAGGAIVGALTGNPLAGAAIGAAGGALVGVLAGDRNRFEDRDGRRFYYEPGGRQYSYDRNNRRYYTPRR